MDNFKARSWLMDSEEGKNDDDGDQAFLFLAKMVKLMRNLTVKSSRGFFNFAQNGHPRWRWSCKIFNRKIKFDWGTYIISTKGIWTL